MPDHPATDASPEPGPFSEGARLHPQARALLGMLYRVGAPAFHTLDVAAARAAFRRLQFALRPEPPAVAAVEPVRVAGAAGPLRARHYRPAGAGGELAPLLVWFHGGGWTVGDLDCYDALCRSLCLASGCAVLSVDYRLAPEYPFPAAPEDAIAATAWAMRHAGSLGADPARVAVGGDSAGGNLALVAALALREAGGPQPRFQLLVYPSADLASERASHVRYGVGFGLDAATIAWFHGHYLPNAGAALDWRASPLRAASLSGLPPALILSAGCDPLVDDCHALAARLAGDGVAVEHIVHDGVVHGFVALGKLFDAAAVAIDQAGRALRAALRPGDASGAEQAAYR